VLGVCGIRIGWIYTVFQIPRFHTPESLYISYPISWTLTFLCQILAFILIYRRKAKNRLH
jgi:tryptophan-rich sensory protein